MTRVCEGDDIVIPPLGLGALLRLPPACKGLIVFAHGSGSSRFSVRNAGVAAALNQAGFATLLLDLLLAGEADDRGKVFDIRLLADRLIDAIEWADASHTLSELPLGLFGASTGAAAALVVAADLGDRIKAVVSRGGRPDLAGPALPKVHVPTLLIVGGNDDAVIALNQAALITLVAADLAHADRPGSAWVDGRYGRAVGRRGVRDSGARVGGPDVAGNAKRDADF